MLLRDAGAGRQVMRSVRGAALLLAQV